MPLAAGMVALTCAGCSGGGDASADASTTVPEVVETTVATTTFPSSTSTTTVPLYSFDGSVPPPELVNTGDDFDAIYRSLDEYGNWLLAHNPDVALIGNIVPVGTEYFKTYEDDLAILNREGLRLYLAPSDAERIDLVDLVDEFASLLVTHVEADLVIVDSAGAVVDRARVPRRLRSVLMVRDGAGYWRLVSLEPAGEAVPEP